MANGYSSVYSRFGEQRTQIETERGKAEGYLTQLRTREPPFKTKQFVEPGVWAKERKQREAARRYEDVKSGEAKRVETYLGEVGVHEQELKESEAKIRKYEKEGYDVKETPEGLSFSKQVTSYKKVKQKVRTGGVPEVSQMIYWRTKGGEVKKFQTTNIRLQHWVGWVEKQGGSVTKIESLAAPGSRHRKYTYTYKQVPITKTVIKTITPYTLKYVPLVKKIFDKAPEIQFKMMPPQEKVSHVKQYGKFTVADGKELTWTELKEQEPAMELRYKGGDVVAELDTLRWKQQKYEQLEKEKGYAARLGVAVPMAFRSVFDPKSYTSLLYGGYSKERYQRSLADIEYGISQKYGTFKPGAKPTFEYAKGEILFSPAYKNVVLPYVAGGFIGYVAKGIPAATTLGGKVLSKGIPVAISTVVGADIGYTYATEGGMVGTEKALGYGMQFTSAGVGAYVASRAPTPKFATTIKHGAIKVKTFYDTKTSFQPVKKFTMKNLDLRMAKSIAGKPHMLTKISGFQKLGYGQRLEQLLVGDKFYRIASMPAGVGRPAFGKPSYRDIRFESELSRQVPAGYESYQYSKFADVQYGYDPKYLRIHKPISTGKVYSVSYDRTGKLVTAIKHVRKPLSYEGLRFEQPGKVKAVPSRFGIVDVGKKVGYRYVKYVEPVKFKKLSFPKLYRSVKDIGLPSATLDYGKPMSVSKGRLFSVTKLKPRYSSIGKGVSRHVSLAELEAMEEGVTLSQQQYWRSMVKPKTTPMLTPVSISKSEYKQDYLPLYGTVSQLGYRSDVAKDFKRVQEYKQGYIPVSIVGLTPVQESVQQQQLKYRLDTKTVSLLKPTYKPPTYKPAYKTVTETISERPYHPPDYKPLKPLWFDLPEGGAGKKGKKLKPLGYDLGYRHRKHKVPRIEDILLGGKR